MRHFLAKTIAVITRKPRYFPVIEFSGGSLFVHDFFRVIDYLFGRQVGIKLHTTGDVYRNEKGVLWVIERGHTLEASLAIIEGNIRKFLRSWKFVSIKIYVPAFSANCPVYSSPYLFAIARDSSADDALGASPNTSTALTISGSNRTLWLGSKGAASYSTGATWDSTGSAQAMTSLNTVTPDVGEYNLTLYVLKAPATGNLTMSVTVASSNVGYTFASYTDCDQTTQPDSAATINTNGPGATSLTSSHTTTTNNAWVIGYFSSSANTLTASTGINFLQAQTNNVALGDSNSAVTPAASYSMTCTAGSGRFSSIMASIRPAGGATVNSNFFRLM